MSKDFSDIPSVDQKDKSLNAVLQQGFWKYLSHCINRYGDIFKIRLGHETIVLAHPDHVTFFNKNPECFTKKIDKDPWSKIKLIMREGIGTIEGEQWLKKRKLLAPQYSIKKIQAQTDRTCRATTQMLDDWDINNGDIDFNSNIRDLLYSLTKQQLIGLESTKNEPLEVIINQVKDFLLKFGILLKPAHESDKIADRMSSEINQLQDNATQLLHEFLIERNKLAHKPLGDITHVLETYTDEATGESFSEADIITELFALFFASHSPVRYMINWAMIFLSQYPDTRSTIVDEIDTVLNGNPPTPDTLKELTQLDGLLKETLRLKPPAPVLFRWTTKEIVLNDTVMPVDTLILLPIYHIHRREDMWATPEEFQLTRFLDGQPKTGSYLPFGAGKHTCIGQGIALHHAKVIISLIHQRFVLDVIPGADFTEVFPMNGELLHGLKLSIQKRQ